MNFGKAECRIIQLFNRKLQKFELNARDFLFADIPLAVMGDSGSMDDIAECVAILTKVKNNPKRPYTVILGGAKVKDKIGVINSLVNSCDYILIGGGMSYSFLEACGYNVGSSLLDNESYDYCKNLLERYQKKIILPLDVVVCKEIKDNIEHVI